MFAKGRRAGEMADNLSLLLRTYTVEGGNQLSQTALWPPQAHTLMQSKKEKSVIQFLKNSIKEESKSHKKFRDCHVNEA